MLLLIRLVISLCVATVAVESWIPTYPMDYPTCESITVPLCLNMKYNFTRLPNHIGYIDQTAIRLFTERTELTNLVKTKCSSDLVFFLCATLVPICINGKQFDSPPMVRPCRNLCESVYKNCITSMRTLNFKWPANLNCSDLPDHATGMCIGPRSFTATKPGPKPKEKTIERVRATCRADAWKKKLKLRNLNKYDHIFQAKRVPSRGQKTRVRLLVQRFFKPTSKKNRKVYVHVRQCRHSRANLLSKNMFLVLGNKENNGLKISEVLEWKSSHSKDIRLHFRRRGHKG